MRRVALIVILATLPVASHASSPPTIIGDLNNFDTLNDTGQICYGFEIEIDGVHSTDITYTYDWNHYGAPKIREDNTDPANPKVFVRYESAKDANGNWGANNSFTNVAIPTITPPQGHTCTDPSVNEGCEHFGVGYYGTPTTVKYNWLVDGGAGTLVYFGAPVSVGTPTWTYTPPAGGAPANVVAAIPAPVVPIPAGKQFGEPSWVKVIKTTTHNANPVRLQDLISDDADGNGLADWQNNEPSEIETEWKLLQANNAPDNAKDGLQGGADDMADGSEIVTRRYEFYRYGAAADTLDGETGEAMCSEVNPTTDPNDPLYLHGIGTAVAVTDPDGKPYSVNCEAQVVVGTYVGAQMAGFAAIAALGMIDHLQEGEVNIAYTPRTVVIGGQPPYLISTTGGSLPPGLSFDVNGVLSGTPTGGGDFPFTLGVFDANSAWATQTYSLHIVGAPLPQIGLDVQTLGSGTGTVSGSGINCQSNVGACSTHLDAGTLVSLTAAPSAGSIFGGWSNACTGTGGCSFTLNAASTVAATFTRQWLLSVTKAGAGAGTVSGSGIDCGATCSLPLDDGTAVSLTATPTGGNVFIGWTGDCSGAGACNTTMSAARSVTATFVPPTQLFTLTVDVTGSGTVTSSPNGIRCGKQCTQSYPVSTSVTLSAKTTKRQVFLGWTGACVASGTSPTCTLTLLGDQSAGAVFR